MYTERQLGGQRGQLLFNGPERRIPAERSSSEGIAPSPIGRDAEAGLAAAMVPLPISFEPLADGTGYWSRGDGYNLVLNRHGANFFSRGSGAVLHLTLDGGHACAPQGLDPLPGRSNYFIGNDASRWRTNVPHFAKVDCGEVYPGVQLIYYGNQQRLEYDLVVRPGADPARIRLAYRGARSIEIGASGELVVRTAFGEVHQGAPQIYQVAGGVRQRVSGGYRLLGRNRVGFEVASYDRTRELVIDPMLTQVLGFGGTAADTVGGVAIDAAGNRYMAITTSSPDFPGPMPPPKGVKQLSFAGMVKLDPTGATILLESYFGGTMVPSQFEPPEGNVATAIALDTSGNIYLGGFTGASDFPIVKPINANFCNNPTCSGAGFVLKLDPRLNNSLFHPDRRFGEQPIWWYRRCGNCSGRATERLRAGIDNRRRRANYHQCAAAAGAG